MFTVERRLVIYSDVYVNIFYKICYEFFFLTTHLLKSHYMIDSLIWKKCLQIKFQKIDF